MSDDDISLSVSKVLVGHDQPIPGVIHHGQIALARLETNQTWPDWCAVINALAEGRKVCAAASGGQSAGKRYNAAIGRWLRCYGFDRIHKSDRSRLLKCADHLEEINAWRAGLPLYEQLELNHPRTVFNRWQRSLPAEGKKLMPRKAKELNLRAILNRATEAELTEALAGLGLAWFMRVMPASWRKSLQDRVVGQVAQRARPNARVKDLRLVVDNEDEPRTMN
jgi:hypothetical protein